MTRVYQRVATWPPDFQRQLRQLQSPRVATKPAIWVLTKQPIRRYRQQLVEHVLQLWDAEDYQRVGVFVHAMRRRQRFPPLIVKGDELHDGYHRLAALLLLGKNYFPVIDLDQQHQEAA